MQSIECLSRSFEVKRPSESGSASRMEPGGVADRQLFSRCHPCAQREHPHCRLSRRLPPGCMNDSAGKFCPDIMSPSAVANVQKETKDAWVGARVQAACVAASDGCGPS